MMIEDAAGWTSPVARARPWGGELIDHHINMPQKLAVVNFV
jgi:hypothetical protein